jgi:hemolysin-activating ACP:hemolysin acyltransferase
MREASAASKNILAAFGEITSILMRSPQHKHHSLADLEWLVVPAVMTGQFTIAEAHSKANGLTVPVGMVFWASLSDEVEKRLSESLDVPLRLKPEEWKSGNNLWLVEAIGDQKVTQAILKRLAANEWAGRVVRFRGRDKDGKPKIGVLSAKPAGEAVGGTV